MKNLFYYLFIIGLIVSCNKEANNSHDLKKNNNLYQNLEKVLKKVPEVDILEPELGLRNSIKVLHFKNEEHFLKTAKNLEILLEEYDNEFLKLYPNLTSEEYFEIEDEIEYDDDAPLKRFFKTNRFEDNLLSLYWNELTEFHKREDLDFDFHPSEKYGFQLDDILMALVNKDGVVIIGKKVFILGKGETKEYSNIKKFFLNYEKNISEVKENAPTKFYRGDCLVCKNSGYKNKVLYSGDTYCYRQLKHVLRTTRAHLSSYKKNWKGRWKKWRTKIYIGLQTNMLRDDCRSPLYSRYDWEQKNRKTLRISHTYWGVWQDNVKIYVKDIQYDCPGDGQIWAKYKWNGFNNLRLDL